jgi:hypothetical protein
MQSRTRGDNQLSVTLVGKRALAYKSFTAAGAVVSFGAHARHSSSGQFAMIVTRIPSTSVLIPNAFFELIILASLNH